MELGNMLFEGGGSSKIYLYFFYAFVENYCGYLEMFVRFVIFFVLFFWEIFVVWGGRYR